MGGSGSKPDGVYKKYDHYGGIKEQYVIKNGALNGWNIKYWISGSIKSRYYYINGKLSETGYEYDVNGSIITKKIFRGGYVYKLYDIIGGYVRIQYYSRNKLVRTEMSGKTYINP